MKILSNEIKKAIDVGLKVTFHASLNPVLPYEVRVSDMKQPIEVRNHALRMVADPEELWHATANCREDVMRARIVPPKKEQSA